MVGVWESRFVETMKRWEYSNAQIDAIVCSGDFGWTGDKESIAEGVFVLAKVSKDLGIPLDNVIVCPGNHDLNRDDKDGAFNHFEAALKVSGIHNYCGNGKKVALISPKNIPIIAVNSCLGATERSIFVDKYRELVKTLDTATQEAFIKEAEKLEADYLIDYLDIPAITPTQRDDLVKTIDRETKDKNIDTAIIMMHHHLFPPAHTEVRPYCNILDAGMLLKDLREMTNNIFVLHGHVHNADFTLSFSPRHEGNFISTLGVGAFDGDPGASTNIIELFFSDIGEHLITMVYSFKTEKTGGYTPQIPYRICDRKLSLNEQKIDYHKPLTENRSLLFSELATNLGVTDNDTLVKVILHDPSIKINRNSGDDFTQWRLSK